MNIDNIYATIVFILKLNGLLNEDQVAKFITEMRFKPMHPVYEGMLKQLEDSYAVAIREVEAPNLVENIKKDLDEETGKQSDNGKEGTLSGTSTPSENTEVGNEGGERIGGEKTE